MTGLGLVREAVDDTAGAAKVIVELLEAIFLVSFQVFLFINGHIYVPFDLLKNEALDSSQFVLICV